MRAPSLRDDPIPVVENAVVWTAAVFAMISTLATLGIVGVFVAGVIARWVGDPFDITNMVQGLLVLATFAGLAWTTVRGEHVSVQVVSERLSPKVNHIIDIFIWTLAAAYLIWLISAAFERTISATIQQEVVVDGVGFAPMWPWRWAFTIPLIPFLLIVLLNLARSILNRRPYDDVIDLEELAGREIALMDADLDADGVIDSGEALKAASLASGRTLEDDTNHTTPEGEQR